MNSAGGAPAARWCADSGSRGTRAARQRGQGAQRAWIAAPLCAAFLASCASIAHARELRGEGLGSSWKVSIADQPAPRNASTLQNNIQQQIDNITHQLSRWDSTSALSKLNAAPGEDWHPVPTQLFTALSYALDLAADTAGAYDPTVAPLVDLWGFGTPGRRYAPPSASDISAARARIGWSRITLDTATRRVRRPAGMQIDLSSMTHGLAADQIAAYLRGVGVQHFLIDVGSELRAQGNSPAGHNWQVALERPPPELSSSTTSEQPLRVIALRDAGIATSGNYRYFFDYNGRRYSHRIDPRTGEPIAHSLAAVTVIAPECRHADALATALTVLGPDGGFRYAQNRAIAALFVLRSERGVEEKMTREFAAYLEAAPAD
jgi:FAD:protein FMN transferase